MPDVRKRLAQTGFATATTTPDETAALIRADMKRMGDVIKRAAVKVN